MLQWKAAYCMQSWDSPFGASSGKLKIGTKPLAVGQKLRICGKPWWQAKGHQVPSTLLICLSSRLCLFWKLDLNSAEELHLQSRPRVPLAHRFTLRAINLVPPCPTLWPHPNHSQQRYWLTCSMQKLRSFIHYPALPWQTLWPRQVSRRFSKRPYLHVSHQSQSNQFRYPMLSNSLFDENGNLDLCTKEEGTLDFPGKSPENRNLTRNAMEICEPLSSSRQETRPPTVQLESQALFTGFPEPVPVDNGPLWPETFPASKLAERTTHRASVAL